MPEAEAILEKYIEVIGGKEALEKVNSKISETITSIEGEKNEIKTITFMKRPNKAYAISEFRIFGKNTKTEGGTDGDVVWQILPGVLGSKRRVLHGKERLLRLADFAFDTAAVAWKDYYKGLEMAGEEEVDGRPCYKVAFIAQDGDGMDTICFFDKETFLINKIVKETYIQEKQATAEIYLSNYQQIDGLKVPMTLKRFSEGSDDIVINIKEIQLNVDIPDSRFELPEKIKEIAQKQA